MNESARRVVSTMAAMLAAVTLFVGIQAALFGNISIRVEYLFYTFMLGCSYLLWLLDRQNVIEAAIIVVFLFIEAFGYGTESYQVVHDVGVASSLVVGGYNVLQNGDLLGLLKKQRGSKPSSVQHGP